MNIPTSTLKPPLPPPPPAAASDHSWLSNSSLLLPIIAIVAIIIIAMLIYAFLFAVTCPTSTISDRLRRNPTSTRLGTNTDTFDQLVSTAVYKEAADAGKDSRGGGECPVCLTAFVDGEVIKEVRVCKHLFHGSCIDVWLRDHSSCPVCRVFVGVNLFKPLAAATGGDGDFQRGFFTSADAHFGLIPATFPTVIILHA